ncbi:phosphate acyltransferase PlsX [Mycoplasmopsis cynos]|uniref:Phosphate acyltransferase n=1 Tax=Mycoplasmopsis cynos (strain C142) TaxID=1246955 RepID=L0RY95_MYCC1|nr:phosphate acyltransferase PlsX [Mycoplasmopsis cynos]CCP24526.1 Phosphate acyltransferase [Mycoplasmopsis cynos C142]
MKKIIIDTNGLDNGPYVVYNSVLEFTKKFEDVRVTLIGDFNGLKLKENSQIKLIQNSLVPSDPKNIRAMLKEKTSMNQAIMSVVNNENDGVISGGDSGSYIASLIFKSKRIEGILRPAFMPVATGLNGRKVLLLDVGANLEVKPENLYEWAKLATIFHKTIFSSKNPEVTLLNIGTEEYKGLEYVKLAAKLIENDQRLNYIGFSEPRDILRGMYDVAVIDGYGGNLVLKSYEGAIFTFKDAIKSTALSSIRTKIGALLMKPAFKKVMNVLDYRNVGAAWVIGVNNLALKIHGSSDEKSIYSALFQMYYAIEKELDKKLREFKNV